MANRLKSPFQFNSWKAITKHDTTVNLDGCRAFFVTGAGNVAIRHRDGSTPYVLPVIANVLYEVGANEIAINSTDTTATGIHGQF